MNVSFQDALARRDLAAMRRCPKADLHNHLGGDPDYVFERTGRRIVPLERPLSSIAQMHQWADENFGAMFNDAAGRLLGFELTLAQAARDGVTRLAKGEDVWASTLFDGSAQRVSDGLRGVHRAIAPEIEWIPELSMSRHCPFSTLERWLAPYLEQNFYRTFDLSGDELAQPIEVFIPLYRSAKAAGLRLKAHVGEFGTADDVQRAVEELELDEVQHGIAAADSPSVMRFLADHRIRLNICPTSNVMLGRVATIKSHPIRRLYDAGIRVTVNTDDSLMFGITVSEEFLALYDAGLFTAAELDQIRLNGLHDN
jgi:adenosine deaminase